MKPFENCPICGGELVEKEVEKLLKGGRHTAVLKARAEVCLRCGERLYATETVKRFEQIRKKLEKQDVAEFQPLGQTFQVVSHLSKIAFAKRYLGQHTIRSKACFCLLDPPEWPKTGLPDYF